MEKKMNIEIEKNNSKDLEKNDSNIFIFITALLTIICFVSTIIISRKMYMSNENSFIYNVARKVIFADIRICFLFYIINVISCFLLKISKRKKYILIITIIYFLIMNFYRLLNSWA